jgi:transposase
MEMFVNPSKIWLHKDFVDFRKSINGLLLIVEENIPMSPFDEALFIFCNKNRDKLKILYWDKTGFALWYKRLEKDKFKWPTGHEQDCLELNEQQLGWLLSGYDVIGHRPLFYSSVTL